MCTAVELHAVTPGVTCRSVLACLVRTLDDRHCSCSCRCVISLKEIAHCVGQGPCVDSAIDARRAVKRRVAAVPDPRHSRVYFKHASCGCKHRLCQHAAVRQCGLKCTNSSPLSHRCTMDNIVVDAAAFILGEDMNPPPAP